MTLAASPFTILRSLFSMASPFRNIMKQQDSKGAWEWEDGRGERGRTDRENGRERDEKLKRKRLRWKLYLEGKQVKSG